MPSKTGKPYLVFIGDIRRLVTTSFFGVLSERLGVQVIDLGNSDDRRVPFDLAGCLSVLNAAEAVIIQLASRRIGADEPEPPMRHRPSADFARLNRAAYAERGSPLGSGRSRNAPTARIDAACQFGSERVRSLIELIEKVTVPRILLRLVDRPAGYTQARVQNGAPVGALGTAEAREAAEIAAYCDDYVECEYPPARVRSPKRTSDPAGERDPLDARDIAITDALEPVCRRFLGNPPRGDSGRVRFVVIGAARTGTSLLVSLLNANQQCLCGGELFNEALVAEDVIPWPGLEPSRAKMLLALRRANAGKFWDTLSTNESSAAHRAVGFKLLYWQGLERPGLLENLAADKSTRVIHITRRNLLRRAVSERQAEMTGQWLVKRGAPVEPCPPVAITADDVAGSIARIEAHQREFDTRFAGCPTLRVIYEDLANNPNRLTARALAFLGLEGPACPVMVKYERTGAKDLADAVVGLDDLRARVRRWASFFDD